MRNPLARQDILTQFLADGSAVLFDPLTSTAHELNPTAALVWDCCDGNHTPDAIAATLAECFGLAPADCRTDVDHFVTYLGQLGLLAEETP